MRDSAIQRTSTLWRGLTLVAFLALPITLWRSQATGGLPLYGMQIALALVTLALSKWQPRMPFKLGVVAAVIWLTLAAVALGFISGRLEPSLPPDVSRGAQRGHDRAHRR